MRVKRTSTTPALPGNEEESIAVRILQAHESATPTFVSRLSRRGPIRRQLLMKLIYVADSQDKVRAPSTFEHRLELLHQSNSQRAGADGCYGRLGCEVLRHNLKSKLLPIKRQRLFKIVNFQKQQVETRHQFVSTLRSSSESNRHHNRHRRQLTKRRSPAPGESVAPDASRAILPAR